MRLFLSDLIVFEPILALQVSITTSRLKSRSYILSESEPTCQNKKDVSNSIIWIMLHRISSKTKVSAPSAIILEHMHSLFVVLNGTVVSQSAVADTVLQFVGRNE